MNPEGARPRYLRTMVIAVMAAGVFLSGCGVKPVGEVLKREENPEEETFEWFYSSFDDSGKAAYDAFRSAAEKPFDPEPAAIKSAEGGQVQIPVPELDKVYQGFLYDHPELFWLSSSYSYRESGGSDAGELADAVSVIPIPQSAQELERQVREFESEADKILDRAAGAERDRERARALYDCLVSETEYTEEALYDSAMKQEHTAFGAVVNKKAVCDGIALAYKYLLDRCGIRCIPIPGNSEGAPHVWNTVFWDGGWHECDPTWDTVSGEYESGQYFDLTTEEMDKDHLREEEGIALLIPRAH